jgi:glycerol-3-phosphate acyltransferase PlsY
MSFRYSSLAALAAALVAPIAAWQILGVDSVAPIAVMSLLLFWRHRENIRKLLAGTESRIGKKAATP